MLQTEQMLQTIENAMNANILSFEKGENVDIKSFDEGVRQFCYVLASLPANEAKKYEANLAHIIARLTEFIPQLEARKNELEDKINSLNKRNKAYNAYGNAMFLALQNAGGD